MATLIVSLHIYLSSVFSKCFSRLRRSCRYFRLYFNM